MKKHQLARALRQRQHQLGLLETHVIDATSDDELIDSYITCSDCGEKQVTPAELTTAIDFASTVEQFLDICESFAHARATALAATRSPRRVRTRRGGRRTIHLKLPIWFIRHYRREQRKNEGNSVCTFCHMVFFRPH